MLKMIKGIESLIKEMNESQVFPKPERIQGIYCLLNDKETIYIGMSQDIMQRINSHAKNKAFTHFKYVHLPALSREEIRSIESLLIAVNKPPLNSEKELASKKISELANAIIKVTEDIPY